ncbi:MAG: hypothetical protein RJB38_1274 [Pseudomonadota bacterium]|jgi:ADP-heptose:LPS heptosyltransferase
MSPSSHRVLVFRLSSFGDIVLATAALGGILRRRPSAQIDWVVASEFKDLLEGHPQIREVVVFSRRAGFLSWHRFCRALEARGYHEVIDLHGSLRTRYAFFYFLLRRWISRLRALARRDSVPETDFVGRWTSLSKQRFRRLGFFLAKKWWPRMLRPAASGGLVRRAAALTGGTAADLPDFSFLLSAPARVEILQQVQEWRGVSPGLFLSVMPGAAWPGKQWPSSYFAEVFRRLKLPVVVLGTSKDRASEELFQQLKRADLPVFPAHRSSSIRDTSHWLRQSALLVSNDTGLVHLAESIGVPVVGLFGPTDPELGFGPWRPESRSVSAELWCRPCSKDGTACFRRGRDRYRCMTELHPEAVIQVVQEVLKRRSRTSPREPQS